MLYFDRFCNEEIGFVSVIIWANLVIIIDGSSKWEWILLFLSWCYLFLVSRLFCSETNVGCLTVFLRASNWIDRIHLQNDSVWIFLGREEWCYFKGSVVCAIISTSVRREKDILLRKSLSFLNVWRLLIWVNKSMLGRVLGLNMHENDIVDYVFCKMEIHCLTGPV